MRVPPHHDVRARLLHYLARVERAYAHVRILSVDVSLAALGGGILASRLTGDAPRPAFYVLLPLAVWVAYTLDHLLDARRVGPRASTPRHRFHFRHWNKLAAACIAAAVACCALALGELTRTGVYFGLTLALLCGAHEIMVKLVGSRASPLLMKELGVAIVFTAGTWGLPLARSMAATRRLPTLAVAAPLAQYGVLALVNLIEFSIFEADADTRDGHTSFVQGVGRLAARRVVWALLAIAAVLAISLIGVSRRAPLSCSVQVVYLVMIAGLAWLMVCPRAFAKAERFRLLGDGVFLLPLLIALA